MQVTTDGLASLRRLAAPSREFEGVSHPRVCPGRGRETAVGEPGHWVIGDRRHRRVSRKIAGCPGPAWRLTSAGY
jgi:hypothetical protein